MNWLSNLSKNVLYKYMAMANLVIFNFSFKQPSLVRGKLRVHFSTSSVAQHIKKFQTIVTFTGESKVRIVFERISETVISFAFMYYLLICAYSGQISKLGQKAEKEK